MAFPADLTLVTVTCQADLLPDGGAAGSVTIAYDGQLTGSSIVPYVEETEAFVAGTCDIEVPATNDPQWTPQDFTYTVTVIAGGRKRTGTLQLDYQDIAVNLHELIQWDNATVTPGTTYPTLAQLNSAATTAANATAAVAADVTAAEGDIADLQSDVSTLTTSVATANTNASAALTALWRPTDQGLVGWTFDPAYIVGSFQLASAGLAYVLRIRALTSVITNIEIEIAQAGTSLTDCYALITNDAGAQIGSGAITTDQSAAWQSTGRKRMALTNGGSGVTAGEWMRVVLWANGSALPKLACAAQIDAATLNSGMTAPTLRWSTANTGMTTVSPAGSFNLASQTASGKAIWGAFS